MLTSKYRSATYPLKAFLALIFVILITSCGPTEISEQEVAVLETLTALDLQAGTHFEVLDGGVTHADKEVVVSEYFWYGCSHCFSSEPIVKDWKQHLPENAKVIRVPVVWRPIMKLHAKVFYIGEALLAENALSADARQQLHETLFPVIMNLQSETREESQRITLQNHFAKFGISQDKFDALLASDEIAQQVKQAAKWQKQSDIAGTPTFIIDGKYRIDQNAFDRKEDLIVYGNQIINAVNDSKITSVQ